MPSGELPAARRPTIRRRSPGPADRLPASLHPVLRRVYAARGVTREDELALELRHLLPVGTLDGIGGAVQLLQDHLARGSRILVVGDFDADGATSTAVVVRQLRRLGHANLGFRVPDRMRHGYGLTPALVADLAGERADLLLTVDNGVAAHAGIEAAAALGMQVLVTDHHLPGPTLPACAAQVNPNLHGAGFGSRALAGVGVAFYLMAALTRALETARGMRLPPVADLLDLVALGTVADLVPLDRNNRILVQEGLRRIRARAAAPGLLALARVAGCRLEELSTRQLGHQIAPRINAAGRIDDMSVGIRCLLAEDAAEALALAGELDRLNRERREMEARMREQAAAAVQRLRLAEGSLPAGVTLADAGWHAGIVGLVASRMKDRLHRPVVAFAPAGEDELRGSARSVAGVHVRDVLEAVDTRHPGLIERFGGHAMAAGLTLRSGALARFAEAFAAEVGRRLSPEQMHNVIETDGELAPAELTLETARAIEQGGPWGQGFPEPVFDGEFAVVESRPAGERHLKLWLRPDPAAPPVEAIAFGHFDDARAIRPAAGSRLRLAYRVQSTTWGGSARAELHAEHLESAG
ncbi:MAG: single-stranded-DNA-specific exonuclease RecJ [Steroidobacteraceae bacterium]|nr:single-stranded-DNA-specific exonuclease RecJ [Steroidobacteraceae bacterium]